jgi:hypothetical protein
MDFNFLVSRYDRELDRKDKLTAGVALPVSALAALGGLVVAIARGFSYQEGWLLLGFMVGLLGHMISTGFCLFWLARNYAGTTYEYLPRLDELEGFRHYVEEVGETPDVVEVHLRGAIIKATDANAAANDTRTAFIDRANQTLVAVLVTAAVCGGLYVIDQILKG